MWAIYPDGSVRRASDGVSFVPDPNSDLPAQCDYQAFLAGGGVPTAVTILAPVPTVTGNQWAFALKTCRVASPWRAACAQATDADQIRLDLISRSTPLQLDDPLLVRVAALATPPIDVPTVMSCAQGMPL